MFIDPSWQEGLISLLIAINGASGAPERTALLHPLSPAQVVVIAQALEQGSYRPEQWFGVAGTHPPRRPALGSVPPPVHSDQDYAVVRFGAEPSDRTQVSSRSGGILFEDPFYAVLAAFNAGKGSLAVEVRTSSRELAWARRQAIVDAVRTGTYDAGRYFAERGPLLSGRRHGDWNSGLVSGDDLNRLIFNGRAAVSLGGEPSALYGLYKYVEP